MHALKLTVLLFLFGVAPSCGGGGGGGSDPLPIGLAELHPIDGQFYFANLPVAPSQATLPFIDQLGSGSTTGTMTTVRWVVLNDDRDLYVAGTEGRRPAGRLPTTTMRPRFSVEASMAAAFGRP